MGWESHTVDDGVIFKEAENAWRWVTRLRAGCDCSYFHVTKTQCRESLDGNGILVVPCGNPDWVFETQSENFNGFCGSFVEL